MKIVEVCSVHYYGIHNKKDLNVVKRVTETDTGETFPFLNT